MFVSSSFSPFGCLAPQIFFWLFPFLFRSPFACHSAFLLVTLPFFRSLCWGVFTPLLHVSLFQGFLLWLRMGVILLSSFCFGFPPFILFASILRIFFFTFSSFLCFFCGSFSLFAVVYLSSLLFACLSSFSPFVAQLTFRIVLLSLTSAPLS